ncbi:MAG: hypothetical protein ACRCY8_07240 [Dermatophilaceae bacterium]
MSVRTMSTRVAVATALVVSGAAATVVAAPPASAAGARATSEFATATSSTCGPLNVIRKTTRKYDKTDFVISVARDRCGWRAYGQTYFAGLSGWGVVLQEFRGGRWVTRSDSRADVGLPLPSPIVVGRRINSGHELRAAIIATRTGDVFETSGSVRPAG